MTAPPNKSASTSASGRQLGLVERVLRALAVAYLVALLAVIAAMRGIGERHWAAAAALYLPRIGWALPWPFLTLALAWRGPRRWLAAQIVALALILFPLMGLRLPHAPAPTPGAFELRLLTWNIDTGSFGIDAIVDELRASDADVILLQETERPLYDKLRAGLPGFFHRVSGQFWLASRFPVEEMVEPPRILHAGVLRSPRFVRYRVRTPAGPIRIYNVHLISPRDALDELRGEGLREEIASGRLLTGAAAPTVKDNTELRVAQLEAVAADARGAQEPVIVAGDTNLPTLSRALARNFGDYKDGFAEAGAGLGYTFPAPRHPWMRIDRVLADPRFRVVGCDVLKSRASDHYAVAADLQLP